LAPRVGNYANLYYRRKAIRIKTIRSIKGKEGLINIIILKRDGRGFYIKI